MILHTHPPIRTVLTGCTYYHSAVVGKKWCDLFVFLKTNHNRPAVIGDPAKQRAVGVLHFCRLTQKLASLKSLWDFFI